MNSRQRDEQETRNAAEVTDWIVHLAQQPTPPRRRPMSYYPDFAELLNHHLNERDRSASWLAHRLGASPSTVTRWQTGEFRPQDPETIIRIADILGVHDASERRALLLAAGYGYQDKSEPGGQPPSPQPAAKPAPDAQTAPVDKRSGVFFGDEARIEGDVITGGAVSKTEFHDSVTGPVHAGTGDINVTNVNFGSSLFVDAWKSWNESIYRWSEADEHARSSWAGMVLYGMGSALQRLDAAVALTLLVSVALWIATAWLITPIWQWPLDDAAVRLAACIKYAIASLAIPLAVAALISKPDRYEEYRSQVAENSIPLQLLKFTGALVGFHALAGAILGLIMVWFYFRRPPFATEALWILAAIPLFFSYIAARRIPADRYQMFEGVLKMHEADPLFLAVFSLFGPLLAAFVYLFYPNVASGVMGPALLLALIALALWERRKQAETAASDPATIFLLGFLLPLLFLALIFILDPSSAEIVRAAPLAPLVASLYILSETLLLATLFVGKQLVLTLRGALLLLLFAIALNIILILTNNRWYIAGFVVVVGLLWALWGRRRLRQYLWVHPSFWLLQAALAGSVYLGGWMNLPLWINLPLYVLVVALLIAWAYRAPGQAARVQET